MGAEAGASGGELRTRFQNCLSELEESRSKLASFENAEGETKNRLEVLNLQVKEAQDNYNREMMLHAKDVEALTNLRNEISTNTFDKKELQKEQKIREEKFLRLEEEHLKEVEEFANKIKVINEQLKTAEEQNGALHKQLETMSHQ